MLNAYCTSRSFLGVCLLQDDNGKMLPKVGNYGTVISTGGKRRCVSVLRVLCPIDALNAIAILSNPN